MKTFRPLIDIFGEFIITFHPYRREHNIHPFSKDAPSFRPHFKGESYAENEKGKSREGERGAYLNESIWGDLGQPIRGVVNMVKGGGRFLRGLAKLLLPIPIVGFVGLCLWKMEKTDKYLKPKVFNMHDSEANKPEPSLLLAVKGEGKKLLYDLTNGLLLLLRGALQVVFFTPFLVFRIPLRLFLTHSKYSPYYKELNGSNKPTTSSTVFTEEDENNLKWLFETIKSKFPQDQADGPTVSVTRSIIPGENKITIEFSNAEEAKAAFNNQLKFIHDYATNADMDKFFVDNKFFLMVNRKIYFDVKQINLIVETERAKVTTADKSSTKPIEQEYNVRSIYHVPTSEDWKKLEEEGEEIKAEMEELGIPDISDEDDDNKVIKIK